MTEQHVVLPGSTRPVKGDARRLHDADPDAPVEVTVSLRGPKLPDANQLPSKGLSPEEFENRYSARQEDADTAADVFRNYGLTVDEVSLLTRSMRVSGPAAAMNAAFQTNLGIYHDADQGNFRGRDGALKIPAALDGVVTGVFGLGGTLRLPARRRARPKDRDRRVRRRVLRQRPGDLLQQAQPADRGSHPGTGGCPGADVGPDQAAAAGRAERGARGER